MPVNWYWTTTEKRVSVFELSGRWTWAEYLTAWNAGLDEVAELPHMAYAIVVLMPDVPKGYVPMYSMSAILKILRRKLPNAGAVVIVNDTNLSVRAVVNLANRVLPIFRDTVYMVKTFEEALDQIEVILADENG